MCNASALINAFTNTHNLELVQQGLAIRWARYSTVYWIYANMYLYLYVYDVL